MPHPYARRTQEMQPFLAMEVMERAFAMEREGADVIHLEIGEPDFPALPAATEACIRAINAGETHYTDSRGMLELRVAIANDYGRRFDVEVEPERVVVTNGTSPAMLLVFSLLVSDGDEVNAEVLCIAGEIGQVHRLGERPDVLLAVRHGSIRLHFDDLRQRRSCARLAVG